MTQERQLDGFIEFFLSLAFFRPEWKAETERSGNIDRE
jgi:hypothetical protein